MTIIGIGTDSLPFPLDLCVKERYVASVVASVCSQQMRTPDHRLSLSRSFLILIRAIITWCRFNFTMFKLRRSIRFYRDFPIIEAAKYSRRSVDRLNAGLERFCETLRDGEQQLEEVGVDHHWLYRGAYMKLVHHRETLEDIVEARYIALDSNFRIIIENRIAEVRSYDKGFS